MSPKIPMRISASPMKPMADDSALKSQNQRLEWRMTAAEAEIASLKETVFKLEAKLNSDVGTLDSRIKNEERDISALDFSMHNIAQNNDNRMRAQIRQQTGAQSN